MWSIYERLENPPHPWGNFVRAADITWQVSLLSYRRETLHIYIKNILKSVSVQVSSNTGWFRGYNKFDGTALKAPTSPLDLDSRSNTSHAPRAPLHTKALVQIYAPSQTRIADHISDHILSLVLLIVNELTYGNVFVIWLYTDPSNRCIKFAKDLGSGVVFPCGCQEAPRRAWEQQSDPTMEATVVRICGWSSTREPREWVPR